LLLFQFAYANLADSTLVQQILEQAFSDIRSHEIVGKAKQAFVEVYGGNRSSSSIANDDLVCSSYSIPNDNLVHHIVGAVKNVEADKPPLSRESYSYSIPNKIVEVDKTPLSRESLEVLGTPDKTPRSRTVGQPSKAPSLEVLGTPDKTPRSRKVGQPSKAPSLEVLGTPDKTPRSRKVGQPSKAPSLEVLGTPDKTPRSRKVGQSTNPFAHIFKISRDTVRVKYNSYKIERMADGWNIFETSLIWSLKTSHPEIFREIFFEMDISDSITLFRFGVAINVLSKISDSNVLPYQSLNNDICESMAIAFVDPSPGNTNLPEDIVDRLRKLEEHFSENYSLSLDQFATKTSGRRELWSFWDEAVLRSQEYLRGNIFFEQASCLLRIGIAVWIPDPKTPGDYIISCCFGDAFENTIHIIQHSDSLEVVETELQTR
jgi:hypothetical protein